MKDTNKAAIFDELKDLMHEALRKNGFPPEECVLRIIIADKRNKKISSVLIAPEEDEETREIEAVMIQYLQEQFYTTHSL